MTKENMNRKETEFIKLLIKKPMTIAQVRESGVNIEPSMIYTMLLSLENKGFLLFEEPAVKGSKKCRYGISGIAKDSFAEKWMHDYKQSRIQELDKLAFRARCVGNDAEAMAVDACCYSIKRKYYWEISND